MARFAPNANCGHAHMPTKNTSLVVGAGESLPIRRFTSMTFYHFTNS